MMIANRASGAEVMIATTAIIDSENSRTGKDSSTSMMREITVSTQPR